MAGCSLRHALPHGVDEQAGAELAPKVLQLILLEEDELLLKNLVKGVFVDDPADDVDESDDELALAPSQVLRVRFERSGAGCGAVSYTHLTLPTKA